jgi:anthranilate phosphoribosyltransferase
MVDSKEGSIRDTLQVIYGVADKHKQDIAVLNASAALVIGKQSANFREGVELAREAVRDGRAQKHLSKYIQRCGRKEILIDAEKKFQFNLYFSPIFDRRISLMLLTRPDDLRDKSM